MLRDIEERLYDHVQTVIELRDSEHKAGDKKTLQYPHQGIKLVIVMCKVD